MAAAWKLPLLVLVEHNNYAISVRFTDVSATPTVAERACAYRIWGRCVDGTDVETVSHAAAEAFAHVRAGNGPALLEATCSRFRGHYEGDHDTYRSRDERKRMLVENDPLKLAEARLLELGLASAGELEQWRTDLQAKAQAILAKVREAPHPSATDLHRFSFIGA